MAEIFNSSCGVSREARGMTTSTDLTTRTSSVPPVPQTALDELHGRLDAVRWPQVVDESAAGHGFPMATTRRLAGHWRTSFDWRGVEAELDRLGQQLVTMPDGRQLHFMHAKAASATGMPVLLVHGWPDSSLRFTKLIPLLTAAGHDVVVPTIPGYGFSDQPTAEMSPALVAEDLSWLMTELGYARYAAHGGDWGSAIATALATAHPESVAALHLTDVPWDKTFSVDREQASPVEQVYLDAATKWGEGQTYLLANTTNPDTIAVALSDSPVGLLAWIAEMYQDWSEDPISDDDVLALVSLLWLTNSVRSSMRLYSEPAGAWDEDAWGEESWADSADRGDGDTEWGNADAAESGEAGEVSGDTGEGSESGESGWQCGWDVGQVEVPTGFALFPKDLAGVPPREFAERFFAVERFTVMPRGGHFAALEQPDLLAEDLIAFLAGR